MSGSAHRLDSVCVFCASSGDAPKPLMAAATQFGQILAHAGLRLIYGGGGIGLMGACARAAHEAGGRVFGGISALLTGREGALTPGETAIVTRMHPRKMGMVKETAAFARLPRGPR